MSQPGGTSIITTHRRTFENCLRLCVCGDVELTYHDCGSLAVSEGSIARRRSVLMCLFLFACSCVLYWCCVHWRSREAHGRNCRAEILEKSPQNKDSTSRSGIEDASQNDRKRVESARAEFSRTLIQLDGTIWVGREHLLQSHLFMRSLVSSSNQSQPVFCGGSP